MVQFVIMAAVDVGVAFMYAFLFFSLYFEVFLLVSFIERNRISVPAKVVAPAHTPSVCIVVPCYNEEKTVAGTVRSLLALDHPADKLEIIVVDDGSKDKTYEAALTFTNDPRVRVIRKENGGKHTAMNLALQHTNAELIGCLDADSLVDPGALKEITHVFQDPQVAAVTPGIHVREPQTLLQHMQHVEYRLSIFNRFMLAALGSVFITPGPFSIFRASIIRELGAWRYAHSTEDMEMALRMQAAGYLLANAPRAVVHTITPRTLRALFHQRVRWTYGWLRNAVDYRYMIGNKAYGNLGSMILPAALISIVAAIFFFARIAWSAIESLMHTYLRISIMGVHMPHLGAPSLFYINTSVMFFLIWTSVILILALISIGSMIGSGTRKLPLATPLFVAFYSLLVPLWLSAAVIRAVFKTGVQWR